MLNDIRLHLDADETAQEQKERKFARTIQNLQQKNVAAFRRYIPSIADIIPRLPTSNTSLFVDKHQSSNLVDLSTGNTFYDLGMDESLNTQTTAWGINSALLVLPLTQSSTLPNLANAPAPIQNDSFEALKQYAKDLEKQCEQQKPDTLVIFGLGKASFIPNLIQLMQPKNIVIYEPNFEVFRVSLLIFEWHVLLENAQSQNVRVFLQVGPQDTGVVENINELHEHINATRILFFQHIKSVDTNVIMSNVRAGKWGASIQETSHIPTLHQHHQLKHFNATNYHQWQVATKSAPLFTRNMALFAEHFPDIHKAFINYTPAVWEVLQGTHDINLFNKTHQSFFANEQPKEEGRTIAQSFAKHPNIDGLVFGYSGDKLKHYLHNTLIRQTDKTLSAINDEQEELPDSVKALLVFGLGTGYMLEALYESHDIQHLIICEPNPDFFYAALHAIDWEPIFEKVQSHEYKLYINIGEASSVLFKDVMSQFFALGPYLLNETYIMQGYRNPLLTKTLKEVRQQLQVIFTMGENFDHVLYGLAHTYQCLKNGIAALRHEPSQYLNKTQRQHPVFIVGNGPSLDDNIDIIKAYREQVIVVSCGTALQALHRNGIVPDFHGEVEQNRANFDWISRINDFDYLKQITLISVNGMHPDSIALFKDALLSFKHGESSTAATLAMLPDNSYHQLTYAYPTVSNMAVSLFLALGFEQLYMIGVDLGFAEQSKHHSASSGYYENGQQIYNYKEVHHSELRAKGNKQDWVFTKIEFNISRMIIEQVLKQYKAECFNLSNGVFIEGTLPLDKDDVLIVATTAQKAQTLDAIKTCYMSVVSDITHMFDVSYDSNKLKEQVNALAKLSKADFKHSDDISIFVENMRDDLRINKQAGGSLYYYYYFNSIHYLCAALGKANLQNDQQKRIDAANKIMAYWRLFVQDSAQFIQHQYNIIDAAEAFSDKRERALLTNEPTVSYYVNHQQRYDILKQFLQQTPSNIMLHNTMQWPLQSDSLIDIDSIKTLDAVVELITKTPFSKTSKHQLVFVFHNMNLVSAALKESCLAPICFISIGDLAEQTHLTAAQANGTQAFLEPNDYVHTLIARSKNAKLFKLILCKPRFCKSGLINANHFKTKDNNTDNDEILPLSVNVANEYESLSVDVIEREVITQGFVDKHYMFKHFVAIDWHYEHADEQAITILDSLQNRGLFVSRKPLAFELLGAWYTQ